MARIWKWVRRTLILVVLAVVAAAATWGFRRVGGWLVVEDALEPAHAIAVLSGQMPARAREAAELYRQGYAAQVWVLRPPSPAEELQQMGIDFVGEEFYSQKVLMSLGVPVEAIRVLQEPAVNTEAELLLVARELALEGGSKMIVVTSKPHTRRVKIIWKGRIGESPRLIVRSARAESYDGAHWWRRTPDALDVVRELLGLANAWAGFPVRPANP